MGSQKSWTPLKLLSMHEHMMIVTILILGIAISASWSTMLLGSLIPIATEYTKPVLASPTMSLDPQGELLLSFLVRE